MLLSAVDRALEEFLQADEPRILAITGEWGRGKSYYWRSFLSRRPSGARRVLVILNSDALSPADRKLFHTLREKVFDAEIAFEPSPEECAAIAFPKRSRLYERATGYAVKLAITNIRVLYRIRRLIDAVADYAMAADDEIQTQIIQSSVLLGWCFNSRDGRAPAFDYVKRLNVANFVDFGEPKKRSEDEIAWNQLLSDYGYTNTDDLDAALCNVLERGYVESESLIAVLSNRAEAVRRARLERTFEEAWGLYHGSFDPDPEPLVSAFAAAVKAGAEVISPMNASSTTLLLRSLGYDALADELMLYWIDVNSRVRPTALNIEASDWKEEVRDPRFRAEAQAAFARLAPTRRSFPETALALAEQNGWNEEDIQVLAEASVDEYYGLFKSLAQGQTGRVVRSLLRFEEFGTPQPAYLNIANRAREALIRIGRESPLNRRRVKAYGIDLDVVDQTSDVGSDRSGTDDQQSCANG